MSQIGPKPEAVQYPKRKLLKSTYVRSQREIIPLLSSITEAVKIGPVVLRGSGA